MTSKIYDLNVWDWLGHDSGYRLAPRWKIDVYECDNNYSHHPAPFQIIHLSDTQAKMLTLGVAYKDGGDYTWDSDFWIDPQGFLDTFKFIPRKVRRYLEELI